MGRKIGVGALIAVAALIAAALFFQREPPPMPRDTDHTATSGVSSACLACHGPASRHPRGPRHPLADDCLRCHSVR